MGLRWLSCWAWYSLVRRPPTSTRRYPSQAVASPPSIKRLYCSFPVTCHRPERAVGHLDKDELLSRGYSSFTLVSAPAIAQVAHVCSVDSCTVAHIPVYNVQNGTDCAKQTSPQTPKLGRCTYLDRICHCHGARVHLGDIPRWLDLDSVSCKHCPSVFRRPRLC